MPQKDTTDLAMTDNDCDALAEKATDDSADPYEREAAIKQLAALDGGEPILRELADGGALTPPEQSLAEAKLTTHCAEQSDDT